MRFKDDQGRDYPDWEDKRLGELYDITSSKRVFQSEWKDSGVPFYRAREIIELSNNGFVDNDLFISPEMYKRYSEKYGAPKQNDLLITGVGTIGKLYIVPKNSNFYIKDGNIIWLKDKNLVSGVFVKNLFLTRYIEKQLFDNASITTVATYTIESAKKTKVLLPVVKEQQKIAAFLSSVDIKIEQLNRKKSLLEQYKKGMMQKLFSQEIRFKDKDGRDYPDWEEKQFSSIAKKVSSFHNPANDKNNYACIELDSLSSDTGQLLKTFDSSEQKSIKVRFQAGDVLFGKLRPYLRKFYLVQFDGVCTSEIWVLRHVSVPNTYLYQLVQSHLFSRVANIQSGTKMPRSDWNIVSQSVFTTPSDYNEQQKIAGFLSAIDRKIELVAGQIEQARTFKQGLLQQMFI